MSLSIKHALKRATATMGVVAAIGVGSATLAAPARADIGNGTLSCVTGELCFYYYSAAVAESSNPTRHFYNSDWYHEDDYFNNRGLTNVRFWDNVMARKIRDTQCGVYLKDSSQSAYYMSNNSAYVSLPSYYQNVNNYHYRNC